MSHPANIQIIHQDEFEALIHDHALVFVDFWADWCAPCKAFSVIYERVAASYPDVMFATVQVDQASELVDLFQIRSIPHLMVFKQGIAIYSEAGSMPESTLKELVQQALCANVDSIGD